MARVDLASCKTAAVLKATALSRLLAAAAGSRSRTTETPHARQRCSAARLRSWTATTTGRRVIRHPCRRARPDRLPTGARFRGGGAMNRIIAALAMSLLAAIVRAMLLVVGPAFAGTVAPLSSRPLDRAAEGCPRRRRRMSLRRSAAVQPTGEFGWWY